MDYRTPPSEYQRHYVAAADRYSASSYRAFGTSGLKVSALTVGTWQNFSDLDPRESVRSLYLTAFDHGINSFDFGNNYGRPPGSAEELFGTFLRSELKPYRDELIITTKAGYDMWPGPNGTGSSLKYLVASLDQSLRRMGLEYVDIFYTHRFDPTVPIEETAEALDLLRRSGKCLYLGISSYADAQTREIHAALQRRGSRFIVHQSSYSIFNRWPEDDVLRFCADAGVGFAAFSPLAQGLLSDKYLKGEAATRGSQSATTLYVNDAARARAALGTLQQHAHRRGQSIAQMAISWTLRRPEVATAVIGVRTPEQLLENLKINPDFSAGEERMIASCAEGIDVDLWKESRLADR
jgi:L-glyceraldehyde 3-phosphate reductase